MIVVCRGIPTEEIVNLAQALYDGGIRFMEVPFDQKNAASVEETANKIKLVREALNGKMHIGAGTVCTMPQYNTAKEAGAEVIVSPHMDEEIILATKRDGLVSMPGCMTPSEMMKAYKLGADFIKLFPSAVVNLQAIKEIALPLGHLPLICFGGVSAENLKQVLAAGVVGVGMASAILNKDALAKKDYGTITQLAKNITQQI